MSVRHFNPGTFPPRKPAVSVCKGGSNADRNRAALRQMSELELLTGMTSEEWRGFHAERRARVFQRYGMAA